jgi:uncharacterized membrane protein YgdD (TMEM256/DUF423 family)
MTAVDGHDMIRTTSLRGSGIVIEMNARLALTLAGIFMFAVVALGAFGAHLLRTRLDPDMTAVWQAAVQYHTWHALALLGIGSLLLHFPQSRGLKLAAWLFVAGNVLFAGSLYAIAVTGVRSLGAITPFGGVAFLAGWAVLAWSAWRQFRA